MTLARTLCLAVLALTCSAVWAAEPAGKELPVPAEVSYYRDVRPIFQQNCQGCHQPAKQQGGFVMTTYSALLKTGASNQPGVVPGQPDKSLIFAQISAHNGKPASMPKGKTALTAHDIAVIEKWIAQGARDDTPASAREVVDVDHPPSYLRPPVVTSLDYSPDGTLLAVSGYHEVLLHRADGSALVARLVGESERIQSVAFSPDGKNLAVTAGSPYRFGEVQIWEVASKKLKLSVPVTYDTLYGASWSVDGTKVAFGCADNTLRAIDAHTGKQVLFQGAHNDWVLGTVFSTDSSHVVSISRDRSMKLTELSTQRFIDNITSITPGALKGGLMALARHPKKDELLVGGSDGTPKIYQMYRNKKRVIGDDFNLIRKFDEMPGRIFAVRYSPDGNEIVAGTSYNGRGEVRVYQAADGKQVSRFEGEAGAVFTLAFRPDGKQVASAGFDGIVRLNDPQTGKLIKEFVPVPLAPGSPMTTPATVPAK